MGIAPSFDDGEAEDPPTPSQPQAADAVETPESPDESQAEEDESIDDYMTRLLERVRQTAGPESGPTRPDPSRERPAPEPISPQTPPERADSPAPAPEPVSQPSESPGLTPRAVAPERSVDLSAMRDLANLSAQAAINSYSRKVLYSRSAGKLMVAIVALAASTALLWIWWVKSPGLLPLYAGVASLGISLFFGGHYLQLGTRLLLTKRGRPESNRDKEAAAQSDEHGEGSGRAEGETGEELRASEPPMEEGDQYSPGPE
jgi:hypothetical protein